MIRLFIDFFVDLVSYREYLIQSVARDLRKKYKRSSLGYAWSMLQPFLMMCVLAVAFSKLIGMHENNYAVFLFCGLLPWNYFESTCNAALSTIRSNARIIDQLPVPIYIFPTAVAFYNMVTFCITLVPLFGVVLVTGWHLSWTMLLIPIVMIPLFLFTMGLSLMLAVLHVFFDDTQHLTSVAFRALYFLCPILYKREHLPEGVVQWVVLNPMFGIIETLRRLVYDGQLPAWDTFALNTLGGLLCLALGLWIFKRASDKFIYLV